MVDEHIVGISRRRPSILDSNNRANRPVDSRARREWREAVGLHSKGVDVDREPAGGQRDRELGSILPANIGNR